MDLSFYLIIIIITFFGFFSIRTDIKTRKVNNYLTLSFLFLSFLILIYFAKTLTLIDLGFILFIILISYFIFLKKIWGAADGKIFIAISLILISYININIFFDYIINLFLIYSISIIILTQIKTSKKDKIIIFKKIDYDEIFFILIFSFVIISIIFNFININNYPNYLLIFLIGIFSLMYILQKIIRKYYLNLKKEEKYLINFILFFIFLYFKNFSFQYYFILIFIFKILIEYISELSSKIKTKKNKNFQSPFTIYLFISAIITLLINENFVKILISIFF